MAELGISEYKCSSQSNNLPGFVHGEEVFGTLLAFWLILNRGVAQYKYNQCHACYYLRVLWHNYERVCQIYAVMDV